MTDQSADQHQHVIGGVDTHHDAHVAAALNAYGVLLGHASFPATSAGYRQLLDWLGSWGPIQMIGVEGTGAYGAGLARFLTGHGIALVEVSHPNRADRRRRSKSDPIDAENAARAVMSRHPTSTAKPGTGPVEATRMLKIERDSAKKARTAALNQMHNLVLTTPAGLRERLEHHSGAVLVKECKRLRPSPDLADPTQAAKRTLRGLARRIQALTTELKDLDHDLQHLVATIAPRAMAVPGTGKDTIAQPLISIGDNPDRFHSEASFAHLCGTAPIPASSERTDKHRLNRAGDRQANRALHMIALNRQAHHPQTRAYKARRSTEQLTGRDITRCLKRHITRQMFRLLRADPHAITHPDIDNPTPA